MRALTIGGAALNQTPIDWVNNVDNILLAVDMARKQGIDVLCLPELCITGYGCEDLRSMPVLSWRRIHGLLDTLDVLTETVAGMTAEAALTGSRRTALQAFLLDPFVSSKLTIEETENLLNEMLSTHAGYLPQFK